MGCTIRFRISSLRNKDSIESEADTFADTGITFNYRVDGDTLVYEYVLDDSYDSLDAWTAPIDRESAGLDVQDLQRQGIIARHHAHAKRPSLGPKSSNPSERAFLVD